MTDPNNHYLSKRVLDRINEEHIAPRPRWEFLFKNYAFWGLSAAAVLLGSLAFAAALYVIQNADWRFAFATHPNLFSFVMDVMPYIWLVALGLFISLAYLNFRHTRRGYRYPILLVSLGIVIGSTVLGGVIYAAGLGEKVEEAMGILPPLYQPLKQQQQSWWVAPEKGLLGGTIVDIESEDSFILEDFEGRQWTIKSEDMYAPGGRVKEEIVRVIGVPATTSAEFHACFIRNWKGGHGGSGSSGGERGRNEGEDEENRGKREDMTQSMRSERSSVEVRSEECKGIRPYRQLRELEESGE